MPDEQGNLRVQADELARVAVQQGESPTDTALCSIAISMIRVGDLLERQLALQPWGPPLVGVQGAGPPEEEKKWYIAKDGRGSCYLTKSAAAATYGPFTREEADRRLDEMGIG